MYGVGTKLITSEGTPSLGGVYKLSAIERDGKLEPRMKISDSIVKVTNPGLKTLYRIYDKSSGMAVADLIALDGEKIQKPLVLTHETERWKTTTLEDYGIRCMLNKIFENGKNVYEQPSLGRIVEFAESEKAKFWDEYKRIDNPQIYKVNLSDGLYELKHKNSQTKQNVKDNDCEAYFQHPSSSYPLPSQHRGFPTNRIPYT